MYKRTVAYCIVCYFYNSESTAEGRRITRLDRILLNGNNITMVSASCNWWIAKLSDVLPCLY